MTERTSGLSGGDRHGEESRREGMGHTGPAPDRGTQPTGDDGAGESTGGQVSAPGEKADTRDADNRALTGETGDTGMADNVGATGVGEPKPPRR